MLFLSVLLTVLPPCIASAASVKLEAMEVAAPLPDDDGDEAADVGQAHLWSREPTLRQLFRAMPLMSGPRPAVIRPSADGL
jgi:hypothetical protein